MDEIEAIIARTFEQAIKNSLNIPRIHRAYNGTPKSTSGKFGPFVSAPLSSGRLQNSVQVSWEQTPQGLPRLVVEFVNAPYWYYISNGREPGTPIQRTRTNRRGTTINYTSYTKFPPLDSILTWISEKPVTSYTDNLGKTISNNTMAFLIGRSIARDGYQGVDFITEAWETSKSTLLPLFGEQVAQYFTDELMNNILIVNPN
jgi:hypothetical protein